MEDGTKIDWIKLIIILLALLSILALFGIIAISELSLEAQSKECSEEYGGVIENGYCFYIVNGISKSYDIRDSTKMEGGKE